MGTWRVFAEEESTGDLIEVVVQAEDEDAAMFKVAKDGVDPLYGEEEPDLEPYEVVEGVPIPPVTLKDKAVIVGRWIAVLPAAVLANILGFIVLKFAHAHAFEDAFCGLLKNAWVENIAVFIASYLSGIIFATAGAYTAPAHRKIVAGVLTSIMILMLGVAIAIAILSGNWVNVVNMAASVAGGVTATAEMKEKGKDSA
jgi:hypothetical protein